MAEQENTNKRVVEAEEFILRGDGGTVSARLGQNKEGHPSLQLFDTDGVERIAVGLDASGSASIILGSKESKSRLIIEQTNEGSVLSFLDSKNKTRFIVHVSEHKNFAALKLAGATGKEQIYLSIDDSETPFLAIQDKEGKIALGLSVDDEGNAAIVSEKTGNILKAFSTDEQNGASF